VTEVLQSGLTGAHHISKEKVQCKKSVPVPLTKTSAAPSDAGDAELKKPVILFNSSGLRLRPRATQVGGAFPTPRPTELSGAAAAGETGRVDGPGTGTTFPALPIPGGSLPELLSPLALPGPDETPLTPSVLRESDRCEEHCKDADQERYAASPSDFKPRGRA
jgi:hypothetical protein